MQHILEIAAFNVTAALIAMNAGADRIELCENAFDGGTTPSYGALKLAKDKINVPVFPIIRPRGGDFFYSQEEYEVMTTDVQLCKEMGFGGVVLGLLNIDGTIDKTRTAALVERAYPMEVTFHRAFDRCIRPMEALQDIIDIGCQRILTSGQYPEAPEGIKLLKELVDVAGDNIIIMPGSGVRSNNALQLLQETGAKEIHASARINISSSMQFTPDTMQENLTYIGVDEHEVKKIKVILNSI